MLGHFSQTLHQLGEGFRSLILPGHCLGTGVPCEDPRLLLAAQSARNLRLVGENFCSRCGATLGPFVGETYGCLACSEQESGFVVERIAACGPYEGVLKELVLYLKFRNERDVASLLGSLLAARIATLGYQIDVLIPIPLGRKRFLQRGYNQAEEIATAMARELDCTVATRALRRVKETRRQTDVQPNQREANMRGAFQLGKSVDLKGKSVMLIDDVLTSGATLRSAARALKKAKPGKLFGGFAARAQ